MKITPPAVPITSATGLGGGGGSGGGGGGGGGGSGGGDVTGPAGSQTVVAIQNVPVCTDTPLTNDVLTFDGTQWCPRPSTSTVITVTSADVSNPPTLADLTAVLGAPTSGSIALLADTTNGRQYFVASDGVGYQYVPMISAAGTTPANITLSAAPQGGWSWFGDPRAVYDATADATVFGYLCITGGKPKIASYLHATGVTTSPVDLYPLQPTFEVDDHDNPSILIRASDGKYLAFFSVHDGPDIYEAVSTNAHDATSFAATSNISSNLGSGHYTYPSPIQLTGETNSPIYLFWRSGTTTPGLWSFAKRNGTASTFPGTVTPFANFTYLKIVRTSTTRIDFAASNHPNDTGVDHGIYHFYYEGGNVYASDGTLIDAIGDTLVDHTNATQVYDGSTTKGWIWDIAIDSGDPRVVYATFPSTTDHRYNYGTWDGASWTTNEIVAAGTYIPSSGVGGGPLEVYYSGGVILDHTDPNTVYLSKQTGSTSVWEIYKYETSDDGASWTPTTITTGSSIKNCRPVSVRDYGGLKALWWGGTYANYTSYSVGTFGTST